LSTSASKRLINRARELDELRRHIKSVRSGSSAVVLLGGEAGIGKSRLIAEVTAEFGGMVVTGGCLPVGEQSLPYLPIIEMLRWVDPTRVEHWPPALHTLIPGIGSGEPPKRAVSRSQLFQGIADLLEQLAGQSPLLVIIEDLHWADRSTRDLISFLIAVLRHKPILLIATYRTSDLDGAHPLRSTLLDWFSRQSVHRIELGPLSAEHSAELVMDRMSLHRGSEMVDVVVEKGGGNPYFLEELAAAAPKIESTPAPLRELLLQRFKDLPGELFELLRIASLGGVTVDDEIVGEIAGLSTEQTLGLLRNGIDSHLLMIDKGVCRFRHALLVEVLQNDILWPSDGNITRHMPTCSLGGCRLPIRASWPHIRQRPETSTQR
jgi:predicted ATPase